MKGDVGHKLTFKCNSNILPLWFFSTDGIPPYNKQISVRKYILTLYPLIGKHDGFYYCYGFNISTKEFFLSEAKLQVYGK